MIYSSAMKGDTCVLGVVLISVSVLGTQRACVLSSLIWPVGSSSCRKLKHCNSPMRRVPGTEKATRCEAD